MDPKIIAVTGARKGIGYEITRQLAKAGHRLLLTARTLEKAIKAAEPLIDQGYKVHPFQLEVTDSDSIKHFHDYIKKEFGRLDVLINNAGILLSSDQDLVHISEEIYSQTISSNAEGPLFLSKQLIDLIPRGGRIINISSGGGSMSLPVGGWSPAYCISKTYLNAITRHLAYYLQEKGISVNAMDPGWVKTDMGGASAPKTVEQGADTAVWLVTAYQIETGKFYRNREIIPW
jgi:NAD(P)-dependent dehydrogenase (short-subunit alcohol dehydrogenase family)